MKNAYDVLGVPKDSTGEQIRHAYRRRAQKAHPDKGGRSEDFHEIVTAAAILSDAKRRAHYDATGEDIPPDDTYNKMLSNVAMLMAKVLEQVADVEGEDLIAIAMNALRNGIQEGKSKVEDLEHRISKNEKARARLSKKVNKNDDRLRDLMLGLAKKQQHELANVREAITHLEDSLAFMAEYSYRVEERPDPFRFGGTIYFRTP